MSKASERIEKAKIKYQRGEEVTDNLLLQMAASRWTLGIAIVLVVAADTALLAWVL